MKLTEVKGSYEIQEYSNGAFVNVLIAGVSPEDLDKGIRFYKKEYPREGYALEQTVDPSKSEELPGEEYPFFTMMRRYACCD